MEVCGSSGYPAFLSLKNQKCLIIGFGKVGQRKLRGVLPFSPSSILVIDKKNRACLDATAINLLNFSNATFRSGQYTHDDISSSFLVFAATDDKRENDHISNICRQEKVLCNNVTTPAQGSFIVPASRQIGSVSIAAATCGASPLLAKKLLDNIEDLIKDSLPFLTFMAGMREIAMNAFVTQSERAQFYTDILDSPMEAWIREKDTEKCIKWFYDRLPEEYGEEILKLVGHAECR